MNPVDTGPQFLWHLFQLHLFRGERDRALEWVASMYERCVDISEKVEPLLLEYWEGNEAALIAAALMAVRNFYFDIERHVTLVAWLVENRQLGIEEAANLLVFPGVRLDDFSVAIRHAIDVAWLINEDKKYGVMNPQQDSLLADALRDIMH